MDSDAIVDFFEVVVQRVMGELPELLTGQELEGYEKRRDGLVAESVPEDLARRIAALPPAYSILGVVDTAKRDELDPLEVARVHFTLGEALGLPALATRILALPRKDRWQTMARAALRDELHSVHAQLTAQVLAETEAGEPAAARVAAWEKEEDTAVMRAVATLGEICGDEHADLARLSVGLRVVRALLAVP
jgi:glutamate dehydrogenase